MPRDSFSLAVFIACEPYLLGFLGLRLQLAHQLSLLVGNFVFRFKRILVDTQFFFLQVAYVTVARHHLVVLAEKLFYGLRLGRRLNNYQVLLHVFFFRFLIFGCKSTQKFFFYLIYI